MHTSNIQIYTSNVRGHMSKGIHQVYRSKHIRADIHCDTCMHTVKHTITYIMVSTHKIYAKNSHLLFHLMHFTIINDNLQLFNSINRFQLLI